MTATAITALPVLEQGLAQFALHAIWQVPLLAAAAWCAIRLGRPGMRVAHAFWVGTLLLCVAMPLVATVAARQAALSAERAAQDASITYEPGTYDGDLPAMERAPAWKRLLHRHLNGRDGLQPFSFTLPQRIARIVSCVYLLALLFFAAQLFAAWKRTRALVARDSAGALPASIQHALELQCRRLGVPVPLARMHPEIAGPALAGVLHPVLLLPAGCPAEMSAPEIEAVLAHELAHLHRRDPLVHAICSLLLVPVAFHPAAMWAARCVRQTREMACDAEAAQHMGSTTAYARALLHVAERARPRGARNGALGFLSNGFFGTGLELFNNRLELFHRSSAMEERMQMLMKSNGSDVQRGSMLRVAAGVALGAVAVLAAGMLQVRPVLASERAAQQSATTTPPIAAITPVATLSVEQDREPRLLSGDHAREQLQHARRQLAEAERRATTDDDRRKIVTARDMMAAAEVALGSAGASHPANMDLHIDLSKLKVQLDAMKLPDADRIRLQMDGQREAMAKVQAQMSSPEWQAQMRVAKHAAERVQAQMQSPEFRQHIEDAMKLSREAASQASARAMEQQARALDDLRSAAEAKQQAEQSRQLAVLEPAPPPFAAEQGSPMKVAASVMAGNVLHKETPVYPAEAKEKKIQGEVLLHAIISEAGTVEQLSVVNSPDTSLSKSALEAVRHWTYKPYLLNGKPMAVDTTITVHYSLVP